MDDEPKKIKLTFKQRIWLSEYMIDGNETRAALVAHYPNFPMDKSFKDLDESEKKQYHTAGQIGYENLRKLEMPLDQLLDEAGLTDVYLVQKMRENLNAVKLYGKDAIEGMDGMARNKALEIALKSKGKLVDKVDHTTKGKSLLPLIISDVVPEKAKPENLQEITAEVEAEESVTAEEPEPVAPPENPTEPESTP